MADEKIDSRPEESQNKNKPESGKEEKLNTDVENIAGNPDAQKSSEENCEKTADEPDAARKQFGFNAIRKKFQHKSGGEDSDESDSKEEDEEKEDNSFVLNENPDLLLLKLERIKNEHRQKDNEYNNLNRKIDVIVKRRKTVIDALEEDSLIQRKFEFEEERDFLKKEIDKIEKIIQEISQKLEKFEDIKRKRPKFKSDSTEFNKEIENVSIESLFAENNLIKNTVLYVATFFPNLSPPEFEQVVSFLLAEQTTTVTVKSQITTEQGETRLIEAPKEKPLTDIWKECQHDTILQNCFLGAIYQEDNSQVIDFYAPQLREKLKKYFKEERTAYLSNQFKQSRFLLFNSYVSVNVAINAIFLSVDMAMSSPYTYGRDWLFEIITIFTKKANQDITTQSDLEEHGDRLLAEIKPEKRINFILARISSLIKEMLDYSQLQGVIKDFLEYLISVKRYDAVLGIVKRLRFVSQFDELYWVKQLLDRGDKDARSQAYKFLYSQLEQSDSRIYEMLETIKTWLPKSDCPPRKYSQSNKYALQLLFGYSLETISDMDVKHYGCYPSKYPLFAPLNHESMESNIKTLISWIFYPDDEGELAIKHIDEDINKTDLIPLIGFLIAGWFMILMGLEKKDPAPEVYQIADNLIRQIIQHTNRSQQKELVTFWEELIDELLCADLEESPGESEDKKLRKQTLRQRSVVKQLKKQFKAAQKTNINAK
ncbi:hypothetical protein [Microseira wollei]|uniref:Uncharacterized protein n=1 Tax=Microseira wollei NIES-4236 TaxID=2530354 RepID=A0AAV3XFC0_9CYAN|nr:hypothetical protein [Microseira wollei]GET41074.1 hypothetical protein MiSe_58860 [Microseira wollei NIES-4236]